MQKILIIGSDGSMGKRYQAIFRYLNKVIFNYEIHLYDVVNCKEKKDYDFYDSIILASPTETHLNYLNELKGYKKPILCEKPLIKNLSDLESILNSDLDIQMMFQYAFLSNLKYYEFNPSELKFSDQISSFVHSKYDYFKTSNKTDELEWDCMQTIALHFGHIEHLEIKNHSPIWDCMINGEKINFLRMDQAYIDALIYWLTKKRISKKLLYLAHEKVYQYQKEMYD